jgi:hypothetical protein
MPALGIEADRDRKDRSQEAWTLDKREWAISAIYSTVSRPPPSPLLSTSVSPHKKARFIKNKTRIVRVSLQSTASDVWT